MNTLRSVAALLACGLACATSITTPEPSCREERDRLRGLAQGTIQEVWEILETEKGPDFTAVGDPENESLQECRVSLLAKLSRAVARTDDARIAARIIDEIDFTGQPALERVLRVGLAHPSPDVRRHAARAAAEAEAPGLASAIEECFKLEADEGVRLDLIKALGATGSRRLLPELRAIAESGDAASRHVALVALMSLPDVESVAVLESIASDPFERDPDLATRVVETLASWRDIPGTNAAIRSIGRVGPTAAASAAIDELSNPAYGDLAGLAEIANARGKESDLALRTQAQSAIESLTSPEDSNVTRITLQCGGGRGGIRVRALPLASWNGDGSEANEDRYVFPASGGASARCWDAPAFMWPGEIRPRIPSGTNVVIKDRFSWNGEGWSAVISPEHMCWLPDAELTEGSQAVPDEGTTLEVDVTIDDAQSWAARTLERGGWLTWLNAGDTIVELRLDADPSDREAIGALVRIRRNSDSPAIALAVGRWLYEHARGFAGDEELGEGIPQHDPQWAEEE